ncbi:MAG: nickel pincer cofactor biosynthesis protein LarB [Anaerolineae bacterium]|nr:nickel pincer cofactor biosynthesis protein LarB [Anaerolineae bacterium]
MDELQLQKLIEAISKGELSLSEAAERINNASVENVDDFAKIDLDRKRRNGFPEVIFGQGKTPEQVAEIFSRLLEHSNQVMATRVNPEMAAYVTTRIEGIQYHARARILMVDKESGRQKIPGVAVVTAGTSDVPVAEEAALTAELMGNQVERVFDVGVAGLHRLMRHLPVLKAARVVVVVAGMEGALVSVVGGLLSCPIIAVPTSVGYGASFNGLAALLAMLNSCASGVSVVNIDNGFGAGVIASRINHLAER